jgi:hypothetical protein
VSELGDVSDLMTTLGRSRKRVYPVLGVFILGVLAVLILKVDETAWALL